MFHIPPFLVCLAISMNVEWVHLSVVIEAESDVARARRRWCWRASWRRAADGRALGEHTIMIAGDGAAGTALAELLAEALGRANRGDTILEARRRFWLVRRGPLLRLLVLG